MSRVARPEKTIMAPRNAAELEKADFEDLAQADKSATPDSLGVGDANAGEPSYDNAMRLNQGKLSGVDVKQSALRTVLLLVSVFLSMFLVALDRTIISTV